MRELEKLAFSPSEFMKLTGAGKNSTYKMLQSGEIKAKRIGVKWVIPKTEIEKWLQVN